MIIVHERAVNESTTKLIKHFGELKGGKKKTWNFSSECKRLEWAERTQ